MKSLLWITVIYHALFYLLFSLLLILMVAYFTLLERKVISAVQRRNGPDTVGLFGLLQPISDALKLLFKEFISLQNTYLLSFILSPILVLFLGLLVWLFLPLSPSGSFFNSDFGVLWFFFISGLNVYILFIAGFSSNNKYAVLGSIRSIVQMLSYEVSFILLIAPVIFITGSFNFLDIINLQIYTGVSNFSFMLPSTVIIFISLLAETNRAPFDLPEAEAELVAGYNVEYSSLPFAFFFLGEYLNMITSSVFIVLMFFSGWGLFFKINLIFTLIFFFMKVLIFIFLIIWVRATLPRIRYDSLMALSWKCFLPFSTVFLFLFISIYSGFIIYHL